ncbi:MAG: thioredoxin domain-containing protein, partial [Actinomycetes bacterium]
MSNRLAESASPYLQQHADNPVDWWPWSPDAFAEAERRDVPVLLSVGYAACHWCHVMAHESFEDQSIANTMNERFVSVKVDREERPDVDAVYMDAVTAMTGHGGWPMTVFLTPQGQPFYAGTYFPPSRRGQMPGFAEILVAVSDTWRDRTDDVRAQATQVIDRISEMRSQQPSGASLPTTDDVSGALAQLSQQYDYARGGFGAAPKFPP